VVNSCGPRYLRGRDRRKEVRRQPAQKHSETLPQKNKLPVLVHTSMIPATQEDKIGRSLPKASLRQK
jgi:hypothetical protein